MEWGRRTFSPLLWLLAINKENTYVVSYRRENEENERTRKTSKWWGNPMTYVLGPGDELSRKFFFSLSLPCVLPKIAVYRRVLSACNCQSVGHNKHLSNDNQKIHLSISLSLSIKIRIKDRGMLPVFVWAMQR